MSGTQHVIEMVDVTLDHPRGGAPLIGGANLGLGAGEVALIVGAAGVGTSRLVAAALGEVTLGTGRIAILGRDVGRLRRSSLRLIRRRIGIVPQDLCLLDDRSAELNVVLPLEIDGIPREISMARAHQVLSQLGLDEHQAAMPVARMSAAERQRVAVARAMVREPELVIADHPTSLQDAHGTELVCTAIAIAAARGAACLVLGRDPALLSLAERHHWSRYGLVDGSLFRLTESLVDSGAIDSVIDEEVTGSFESAPLPSNVVPFPPSLAASGG